MVFYWFTIIAAGMYVPARYKGVGNERRIIGTYCLVIIRSYHFLGDRISIAYFSSHCGRDDFPQAINKIVNHFPLLAPRRVKTNDYEL